MGHSDTRKYRKFWVCLGDEIELRRPNDAIQSPAGQPQVHSKRVVSDETMPDHRRR